MRENLGCCCNCSAVPLGIPQGNGFSLGHGEREVLKYELLAEVLQAC